SRGSRLSASTLPGDITCGQNESGKLREATRGISIACWIGMPKTATFKNTWSIACCWTSPPGVPNGSGRPSSKAMAGAGVRGGRIRLGQQVFGNRNEGRVAEIGIAIRERELDGLDEAMQIRGRVVAERGEVDAFQHIEHLEQHRPLAPVATGGDLPAAEGRHQGRGHIDREALEIGERERAIFLAVEL